MEWVVRGGLAIVAILLGYAGATFSLARATVSANPAYAHRLAPYDGRITAGLASSLAGPSAGAADRVHADRFARLAWRQDPTAVAAVSTLGINAQVRGDTGRARRLFAHAVTLSRRDLVTQLWSIEDAAARGDVAGALRDYDIALRTRPALAEVLYPVLAAASASPAIRSALAHTLVGKPAWSETFVSYVADHGPDPLSTARLFQHLAHVGIAVPDNAASSAVDALVAGGRIDEAWTYYASRRSNVDRRRSRDSRFAMALERPSVLDWVTISEGGVVSSVNGGIFAFSAPASVGGAMLQQMQLLTPGTYRLAGHSRSIAQEEQARPYWALQCRSDGRELGRVTLPNSAWANGAFEGTLVVPAGCPAQMLVLIARPTDSVDGLSGEIDRVELGPVK